ncbi:MAG: hypothetical protein IPJ88_06820 [Myxococcales bacterium]|nr:MAG: hypothetical protein IPJ88_06820 [Myxococcales bacterium]
MMYSRNKIFLMAGPLRGYLIASCAAAFIFVSACTEASDLGAGSAKNYCGNVVGNDEPVSNCTEANCSFIRRGFAVGTKMTISFSPETAGCALDNAPENWVGVLSSSDAALDCQYFSGIDPLKHDLLSLYEFPGRERLRNEMFTFRPEEGPLALRDVMLFVSYLAGEELELRLIAGSGDETKGDYFGLFFMQASNGSCF